MIYSPNHLKYTPYPVILTQIHKYSNNSWKHQWKIKSNPNRYISKYHHKFDIRINSLMNYAKLNTHQCGILTRLFTEHIELNKYFHQYQIKDPNTEQIPPSPNCLFCNKTESVDHFITKCKKYKHQRRKTVALNVMEFVYVYDVLVYNLYHYHSEFVSL